MQNQPCTKGVIEKIRGVKQGTLYRLAALLSGFFALFLIWLVFFLRDLGEALTVLFPLLAVPAAGIVLVALFLFDLFLFIKYIRGGIKYALPVIFLLCSLLVVCFAPLWDLNTRLNFAFFKEPAETAILKLGDDLLEPVLGYEKIRDVKPYQIDINRELSVPKNCLWVVNDKTCRGIYFFRRGFLDSEAGYLYVLEMSPELEKGDTKSTVSLGGLGSFFISIDLGDGWYYVYTD